MSVLLFTSVPLAPPWDQGDKNLAYSLGRALPQVNFKILTARGEASPPEANLQPLPLYTSRQPTLRQKAAVYRWLRGVNMQGDLLHLIYRPFALSSWLLGRLPHLRRSLHTVPATADERYLLPGLFFSRRVAAISAYGQQRLQRLGLPDVAHIPPGIFLDEWQPLAGRQAAHKAVLGLSGRTVALFPGHYGPGQGAGTLLEALPPVVRQAPQVVFLFACRLRSSGDRRREAGIRRRIEALGLSEHVRLYNTVPDMKALVGASDLLVLPLQTQRDKLDIPTSLLEAMAAGLPLVISDLAPMNEVLLDLGGSPARRDEDAPGLAFPSGDAAALAEALLALLQDAPLRARMGRCAQELAQERYDIFKSAGMYARLYAEMLDES